jgi:hypothetical protein
MWFKKKEEEPKPRQTYKREPYISERKISIVLFDDGRELKALPPYVIKRDCDMYQEAYNTWEGDRLVSTMVGNAERIFYIDTYMVEVST